MYFKYAFSFLCLCSYYNLINCQRYEGDYCTIQRTGQNGICTILKNCQSAIADLQQQRIPQTCSFDGISPIVCCILSNQPTAVTPTKPTTTTSTTTARTTTTTTTQAPTTKKVVSIKNPGTVGWKSKQKCEEYGQAVFTVYTPPLLSAGVIENKTRNDCGFTAVQLVVGGTAAKGKEFPHMALIGYDSPEGNSRVYVCGGSLISERFVLTAGHCLRTLNYGDAKYVRVGDLNIRKDDDDADPQELNVIDIIKHPEYIPPSQYNDIGLLKLEADVDFTPYVRPVCLNVDKNIDARQAIATGWGNIEFSGDSSDHLLKVTLDLFGAQKCSDGFPPNRRLKEGIRDASQLCSGSSDHKDTCQGDSGGPLQIYHADVYCMYSLVGVTSFGRTCGIANSLGVYSRVSNYIDWIEKTIWP